MKDKTIIPGTATLSDDFLQVVIVKFFERFEDAFEDQLLSVVDLLKKERIQHNLDELARLGVVEHTPSDNYVYKPDLSQDALDKAHESIQPMYLEDFFDKYAESFKNFGLKRNE